MTGATSTVSAKTELASASRVGTENIARWKDVLPVVPVTDNVASTRLELGNANATTAGTEKIAASFWRKAAMILGTTTKVAIKFSKEKYKTFFWQLFERKNKNKKIQFSDRALLFFYSFFFLSLRRRIGRLRGSRLLQQSPLSQ